MRLDCPISEVTSGESKLAFGKSELTCDESELTFPLRPERTSCDLGVWSATWAYGLRL
jgi:hypothetical protein